MSKDARRVAWFFSVLTILFLPPVRADVLLVVPENTPAMMSFAERIQAELKTSVDIRLQSDTSSISENYQLAILAGQQAVETWRFSLPAVAILISESQARQYQHKLKSAIYAEPPLRRQIQLARLLFGEQQSVGVLFTNVEDFQQNYPKVQLAALKEQRVNSYFLSDYSSLNSALNAVLEDNGVLVGIANNNLYNAQTIKNILISSYRRGVALIGPTSMYVSAGALASTYSRSEDIAKRLVEILRQGLAEKTWPAPDYNPYFYVGFNEQVARSLNIQLPDVEKVAQQLRQQEQTGN